MQLDDPLQERFRALESTLQYIVARQQTQEDVQSTSVIAAAQVTNRTTIAVEPISNTESFRVEYPPYETLMKSHAEDMQELQNEVQQIRQKLEKATQEKERLAAEQQQLIQSGDLLLQNISHLAAENKALVQQLEGCKTENDALATSVQEWKQKCFTAEEQLIDKELVRTVKEHNRQLQEDVARLETRVTEVRRNKQDVEDEVELLQKQLKRLEVENGDLRESEQKIRHLQKMMQQKSTDVEKLESQHTCMREEFDTQRRQHQQLDLEHTELRTRHEKLLKLVEHQQDANGAVERKITTLTEELAGTRELSRQREDYYKQLEERNDTLRNESAGLLQNKGELQVAVSDWQQRCSELEALLASERDSFRHKQEAVLRQVEEMQRHEAEMRALVAAKVMQERQCADSVHRILGVEIQDVEAPTKPRAIPANHRATSPALEVNATHHAALRLTEAATPSTQAVLPPPTSSAPRAPLSAALSAIERQQAAVQQLHLQQTHLQHQYNTTRTTVMSTFASA